MATTDLDEQALFIHAGQIAAASQGNQRSAFTIANRQPETSCGGDHRERAVAPSVSPCSKSLSERAMAFVTRAKGATEHYVTMAANAYKAAASISTASTPKFQADAVATSILRYGASVVQVASQWIAMPAMPDRASSIRASRVASSASAIERLQALCEVEAVACLRCSASLRCSVRRLSLAIAWGEFETSDQMELKTSSVCCFLCGGTINLHEATGKDVDELPDSFAVRCPHCRSQGLFNKRDITIAGDKPKP